MGPGTRDGAAVARDGVCHGSRPGRRRGTHGRSRAGRAGPGRLAGRAAAVVPAGVPAADRADAGDAGCAPAVGPGRSRGDGARRRGGRRRGGRRSPSGHRLRELPAGVGLDVSVGAGLARRHPDPPAVAPVRARGCGRRGPGRPGGPGPLPDRHDRRGRASRQHRPAIDSAAGLRRRPGRPGPGRGARRHAASRASPLVAARYPAQPRGHARLPLAHGAGRHRGRRLLPDRGDAPAADRIGPLVGAAAGLGDPAGRDPHSFDRRAAAAAPAPAARAAHRPRAQPDLVTGRPGSRPGCLRVRPGQARDRRLRPRRPAPRTRPRRLRLRPAADPPIRPT